MRKTQETKCDTFFVLKNVTLQLKTGQILFCNLRHSLWHVVTILHGVFCQPSLHVVDYRAVPNAVDMVLLNVTEEGQEF